MLCSDFGKITVRFGFYGVNVQEMVHIVHRQRICFSLKENKNVAIAKSQFEDRMGG